MSKKTFTLVSTLLGAVQAASVGLVTYFSPEHSTAINSAIIVVANAIIQACNYFVKPEENK